MLQGLRIEKIKTKKNARCVCERAAGACWPLYNKYSAPRARLVYLLWNKGNCYSMTSRICKRSFRKSRTYQCNSVALRICRPKFRDSRHNRRCSDFIQTNSKDFSSASEQLPTNSKSSRCAADNEVISCAFFNLFAMHHLGS